MRYILASGSPRRQELLRQIDIEYDVITADVDESFPAGTAPDKAVEMLSRRKAFAVYDNIKASLDGECIIIAADTLVSIDRRILGKPSDAEEAFAMLLELSGRSHFVYTGVTLIYHGEKGTRDMTFSDGAEVFFRDLSTDEIRAYIATGEPMDKAGAYGIQERGAVLASGIRGDFYTIVGLPLVKVVIGIKELLK